MIVFYIFIFKLLIFLNMFKFKFYILLLSFNLGNFFNVFICLSKRTVSGNCPVELDSTLTYRLCIIWMRFLSRMFSLAGSFFHHTKIKQILVFGKNSYLFLCFVTGSLKSSFSTRSSISLLVSLEGFSWVSSWFFWCSPPDMLANFDDSNETNKVHRHFLLALIGSPYTWSNPQHFLNIYLLELVSMRLNSLLSLPSVCKEVDSEWSLYL